MKNKSHIYHIYLLKDRESLRNKETENPKQTNKQTLGKDIGSKEYT